MNFLYPKRLKIDCNMFPLIQEDIASEAESGKVYRSTSVDKKGRPVLVMRPSCQVLLLLFVH